MRKVYGKALLIFEYIEDIRFLGDAQDSKNLLKFEGPKTSFPVILIIIIFIQNCSLN